MTCDAWSAKLDAYVDSELPAEQMEAVHSHLRGCPSCTSQMAERLRKGPLPLQELLKIGVEVAAALETAHRAAIVHRDLKPGNIMLTSSGAKFRSRSASRSARVGAGWRQPPLLLCCCWPSSSISI